MIYTVKGKLKDGRACVFESEDCDDKREAAHFFSHYFLATDPDGKRVEVASIDRRTLKPKGSTP